MDALLTLPIFEKMLGMWGPFALIAVAGWYALKWLAKRDDERNAALLSITREFTSVVANNTAAMHAAAASSDRMTAEFKSLEGQVQALFAQTRAQRRPMKKAA